MSSNVPRQVLSRLPGAEFIDREVELGRVYSLAAASTRAAPAIGDRERTGALSVSMSSRVSKPRRPRHGMMVGAPRVGKTETLRKVFDRLFTERFAVVPFYYCLRPFRLEPEAFAVEYMTQSICQFLAFRRNDPRLLSAANEPLSAVVRAALPEDYPIVRGLVDGFLKSAAGGDVESMLRGALSSPVIASARAGLSPFVMIDNFDLLSGTRRPPIMNSTDQVTGSPDIRSGVFELLGTRENQWPARGGAPVTPAYLLCGLRRPMVELVPAEEELFERLALIRVEPLSEEAIESVIRQTAESLGIDVGESTIELMIQQLNRDLFYVKALLDGAASRGWSLRSFMEFERLYTEEVLNGRIGHYLSALLRDVAADARQGRAALEVLNGVIESKTELPIEAAVGRMREYSEDAEELLARLHARELLEIGYGFVRPSDDPVLADYVRAKYRSEISGARRPVSGEELLREKLKHSYRLMMSRYTRAVEAQLVELLSRFDFQSVPVSLFDQAAFASHYRGLSRVQIRRALDDEAERVRLPQIVLVNDLGSGEQKGVTWRLFSAGGFEGGIYSEANEVVWLIALINSKEPVEADIIAGIDEQFEAAVRAGQVLPADQARVAFWFVSKEGFSDAAARRLETRRAYASTYAQLDLLSDYLVNLGATEQGKKPAAEFELVIPIEEDAELIAARTAEQIARAADFSQEAINQIKTALIEACINAAEHSDSPDRRIYQRFAVDEDRLIITVANKGRTFGSDNSEISLASAGGVSGPRGRGLKIIRALMDEVRFERGDDGTTLVMVKFLRRPQT